MGAPPAPSEDFVLGLLLLALVLWIALVGVGFTISGLVRPPIVGIVRLLITSACGVMARSTRPKRVLPGSCAWLWRGR